MFCSKNKTCKEQDARKLQDYSVMMSWLKFIRIWVRTWSNLQRGYWMCLLNNLIMYFSYISGNKLDMNFVLHVLSVLFQWFVSFLCDGHWQSFSLLFPAELKKNLIQFKNLILFCSQFFDWFNNKHEFIFAYRLNNVISNRLVRHLEKTTQYQEYVRKPTSIRSM